MRFRKSINIMKGVRLNFSKSGVSLTVGGKGISANLGGKGLFLNTSIPGTGLYDRKKLLDFGGKKDEKPRAGKEKPAEERVPDKVQLALDEDGEVRVFDMKGAPITSAAVLKKLKDTPEFQARRDALLQERLDAFNAATEAFVNIGALSPAVKKPGAFARRESDDAVEARIEKWLGALSLPIDFHVDFEYDGQAGILYADLDLPEIEHLPVQQLVLQSGGKLKEKDKSQKALKQEYARCVFGLGMFCAGSFFDLSSQLERALISAYTQRRNARTGEIENTYIYSVVYERDAFEKAGYQAEEPEAFACRFRNRMNKASDGALKAIVPYGPADI